MKNSPLSHHMLSLAVSAVLMTSWNAAAAPVVADGVHVDVSDTTAESNPIDLNHGLAAINGGTITANNVTATGTGNNFSHGVYAEGSGSHIDFTGGNASASGMNSDGVSVRSGGSATITGAAVHTSGSVSAGVRAINANSTITLSEVDVSTSGEGSHALLVMDGATITGGRSRLDTNGDSADGIHVLGGSQFRGSQLNIHTTGEQARGVATGDGGALLSITDSTILTEGLLSHGARARDGAVLEISNTQVTTLGAASKGVELEGGIGIIKESSFDSTGHALDVWKAGQASVIDSDFTTTLPGAYGMQVTQDSSLSVSGSRVTTAGREAVGVIASAGGHAQLVDTTIETHGDLAHGIVAASGAAVAAADAFVQTSGLSAHALSAYTGGSIAIDRGTVRAKGDNSMAVLSVADAGETTSISLANTNVYAEQATTFQVGGDGINNITLRGSHADSGKGNLLRDAADGNGIVNFSAATSELYGDMVFSEGYASNIILSENTLLRGTAQYVNDMQLSDSRWDMTGDSLVGNLGARNSTIAFNHDDGAFKTLTVTGDYVGDNALLQMNTVLGDDSSSTDRLHVLGSTAGQTGIAVNNIGGTGALTHDGIQLVQVDGASNGNFNLVGRAVGGAYEYFLHKGGVADPADGDWYLRSQLPVEPPVDPDPCFGLACVDPEGPSPSLVQRPESGAYLANQAAAVGMFDHSMHQRLGEPNLAERLKSDDVLGSAWLRTTTDHTRFNAADGQLDVGTHHSMLQAGIDLAKWGQDSRGLAGVMLATGKSTTQSTSNLTGYGAKGTVDGNALGLYATWYQSPTEQTGAYVDAWVQASRFKNTVQGDALARERYDSKAMTASLEAGYAFKVRQSANSALYVEPQAQVTWTDFSMDDHVENNGTQVRSVDAGGLKTRLGVRVYGHNTATSGNRVQPFVGINWIHTRGESNSLALDETYVAGGEPRDTYQAKVGAQLQLGGGWTGWGELSSTRGEGSYSNYGGQMGVKYSW